MALFYERDHKGAPPLDYVGHPLTGGGTPPPYNKNAEVSIDHFGVFQLITV